MKQRLISYAFLMAIAGAAGALYLPFLGNPLVFDDLPFYSSGRFAEMATRPFGLGLRFPAYFSLAFPQVLWGTFPPANHAEIHRLLHLGLHIACAWALYKLLYSLLCAVGSRSTPGNHVCSDDESARVMAGAGAAIFALHPVAVYGAAYLAQRSTLLATLFSLLSVIFYLRGLTCARYADAIAAAIFYTLAVLSKEHCLPLPAAAVMAAPLLLRDKLFAWRYSGAYLLACLPAAALIIALVRGMVGTVYEPRAGMLIEQISGIPGLEAAGGPWLVSAVTQAGLLYRYLALWVVPDTSGMAIDLRVDFVKTWSPFWIVFKLFFLASFGALGIYFLRKRGHIGMAGFGMLYVLILYTVEFGAVRFQEPFVLYRSYLWAPGILIAVIAVFRMLPRKTAVVLLAAALPFLFYQARDRLQSFSSNLALWQDAAAKLPPEPVPFGSRVLFGYARELTYLGELARAAQIANRCVTQYPESSHCNFSRGAVHNQFREYEKALVYFDRAIAIEPKWGLIHSHRGLALERLGRRDEARAAYQQASRLGFMGGDYRLALLDGTTTTSWIIYDAARHSGETRK